MPSPDDRRRRGERARKRVIECIDRLAERGLSQAELARRLGVRPQVISDVRHARRPISELLARRLAELCDVDYRWLFGRSNDTRRPSLPGRTSTCGPGPTLPVLDEPVQGEPTEAPGWDGCRVAIDGAAAGRLLGAVRPYVLRYGRPDPDGRLHKGDLVLVSQETSSNAEIFVIAHRGRCYLARRGSDKHWDRVANGDKLPGDCKVCGHCVGIIWSPLC